MLIGILDSSSAMPDCVEPFGDSVELADSLIDLVVRGQKSATASALADYPSVAEVPRPGRISIATNGAGLARAVLRTDDVRIGPLSSVDDSFAWDEGEGSRTRDAWLAEHERFFRRLPAIGAAFDADLLTVFERFTLLYGETDEQQPSGRGPIRNG